MIIRVWSDFPARSIRAFQAQPHVIMMPSPDKTVYVLSPIIMCGFKLQLNRVAAIAADASGTANR
jgi:hypothetical protein